jgi:hypothetical protein
MITAYKKKEGPKKKVDGETLSVVDIRREMLYQKNTLYIENTRGLVKKDERWKKFFDTLASFIGEKIRVKVIARVSTINQLEGKQRLPNCGQCIFWKFPREATNRDTGIRMCTNPKTFRGVYSFNPHVIDDKKEIIERFNRQEFYTHKHQSCIYGSRAIKIKGLSEF